MSRVDLADSPLLPLLLQLEPLKRPLKSRNSLDVLTFAIDSITPAIYFRRRYAHQRPCNHAPPAALCHVISSTGCAAADESHLVEEFYAFNSSRSSASPFPSIPPTLYIIPPTQPLHRSYTDPTPRLHRSYTTPTPPYTAYTTCLHPSYTAPTPRLYSSYTTPTPRLHLPYTPPTQHLHPLHHAYTLPT